MDFQLGAKGLGLLVKWEIIYEMHYDTFIVSILLLNNVFHGCHTC
jgi:hypothetical protein